MLRLPVSSRRTKPVPLVLRAATAGLLGTLGCSSLIGGKVEPYRPSERGGVHRRHQSRPTQVAGFYDRARSEQAASPEAPDVVEPALTTQPAPVVLASTQPAPMTPPAATTQPVPATQPGVGLQPVVPPRGPRSEAKVVHHLNPRSIVQALYDLSPLVRASREDMVAAQYGLEEFKTNLSRLEPFVEARGDAAAFPERRDARGMTGEIVGGIQKETFEGAVLRVEGGASGSSFEFGEYEDEEDKVDRGSGGLVRARIEVPFIGSRKRQDRVISAAFQESQARKAELDYFSDYGSYASNALTYYHQALLYLNYARVWDWKVHQLEDLRNSPGFNADDQTRVQSSIDSARVNHDQYQSSYRTYASYLLSTLGLDLDGEVVLEESEYAPSPYIEKSSTPEGVSELQAEAYLNNPRFRVLNDAIKDAQLQRRQAILGRYDITAFVEGTQFPFGAETFDDRVGGWQVGGGVTVRLNDQRVLTASRLKAEAQIRQYQAEIEAEKLKIQRTIRDNLDQLRSNHDVYLQTLEVIEKKRYEYNRRSRIYLEGGERPLTIDDVLTPLGEWTSARIDLVATQYYAGMAETRLMVASGEVYRIVGMEVGAKDPSDILYQPE